MLKKETEQKQTIYNIISSVLIGGINFLAAPIFTRMLGTTQYGLFYVMQSWIDIFFCFMGFQTKEALATGHLEFKDSYYSFRSATLFLGTVISSSIFVLCFLLRNVLASALEISVQLLFVLLLTAFADYTFRFAQNAFIFEKKAQKNLLASVSLVSLVVIFSVILIRLFDDNNKYIGRTLGFTIPYTCYAVILWIVLFSKAPVCYDKKYWKYSLTFGVPIIFHTLSEVILSQSDRVMMRQFNIADSEIGIYSFYIALNGALSMVRNALNISWRPFYYDYLSDGKKSILADKSRNHIELFTAVSCAFLLVSKEVSLLMAGSDYISGKNILPVLVFCMYFTFMCQFPVNFELYHKKTRTVAAGTISAAVVNIILNSILIPQYGMYGAGIATAISYFLQVILHFIIASRIDPDGFHMSVFSFLPWIAGLLCVTVIFFVAEDLWLLRWLLGISLGVFEVWKVIKRRSVF